MGQGGQDLDLARGQPVQRRRAGPSRTSRTSRAAVLGSSTLSPLAAARTDSATWSTPAVLGR
jgi:hypothetical protein